jgi:hypothetical protein
VKEEPEKEYEESMGVIFYQTIPVFSLSNPGKLLINNFRPGEHTFGKDRKQNEDSQGDISEIYQIHKENKLTLSPGIYRHGPGFNHLVPVQGYTETKPCLLPMHESSGTDHVRFYFIPAGTFHVGVLI